MPRGKYVNHKGRSRHFTSPEELQHQHDDESSEEEESTSSEGEAGQDAAAGATGGGAKAKTKQQKVRAKKPAKVAAVSSSEEDSDEESSEEDKYAKKGVSSLIEIENPNRVVKKTTQKLKNLTVDEEQPNAAAPSGGGGAKPELSRREREQIEKQKERLRYEKLHAAGKTNEAKADLARLALIRQQRAEAAAKREAEKKAVEDKKTSASSKS